MQIRTFWFRAGVVALLAAFSASAGNAAAGQAVYERECAQCHGAGGKGDGEEAQYLTTAPKDFRGGILDKRSDEFLAAVVARGGAVKGLSDSMPAFPKLSRAELDGVIAYIRQLGKGAAGK
jgi:mono/diheme cytochrome c family protein